nr:uncharacterized protein LOC111516241 [Leptinotarsa decemlineata]
MVSNNVFLFRVIIFLWVFCAALCELRKRDVHRIVIEEMVPRSHKKGHINPHGHGHKGHSGHGYNSKNKKGKRVHKSQGSETSSSEDSSSYSRENSFEDVFYGRQKQKPYHKKKPSHNRPSYPTNLEIEESRRHQYREPKPHSDNDWVPLNAEQIIQHSHENYRNPDKRKKRKEQKIKSRKQSSKNTKQHHISEYTTSYPLINFDTSTLYASLPVLSGTFTDFDGKVLQTNQSPIFNPFEQPKVDYSSSKDNLDRLRNHRSSYGVREASEADIGSFILVPDSKSEDSLDDQHRKVVTEANKSNRNRGSVTY